MTLPLEAQEWLDGGGLPIHCTSKLRVLRENEEELRQVIKEACMDALLMGVAPGYLRQRMEQLMAEMLSEAVKSDSRARAAGGEALGNDD